MTREEAVDAMNRKAKVRAKATVLLEGETEPVERYETGIIEDTKGDFASIAWDSGGHAPCEIGDITLAE